MAAVAAKNDHLDGLTSSALAPFSFGGLFLDNEYKATEEWRNLRYWIEYNIAYNY